MSPPDPTRINEELRVIKLRAYDRLQMLRRDPTLRANSGYKTFEEAATDILARAAKECDTKLLAWEKANPC